jgi:hypothetical protein
MRRPSGRVPKQPITFLWDRQKEFNRRLACGERQKDIAEDMGYSSSRASIIANSPASLEFREKITDEADKNAADIAGRLKVLSADAVNILESVLKKTTNPFNASLQVKVAEAVLDRAGYARAIKTEGEISHKVSAEGVLGEALKTLHERAKTRQLNEGLAQVTREPSHETVIEAELVN